MLRMFPQLKDVNIDYAWGGTLAVTVNRLPHVGRLEPNVYFAQGYSGHGISTATFAGKVIAEAIAGSPGRFDAMASIPIHTFPGGTLVSYPRMELGMVYYSIIDKQRSDRSRIISSWRFSLPWACFRGKRTASSKNLTRRSRGPAS